MPNGKPAGVRCIQLDEQDRCKIFGRPERPAVCVALRPERRREHPVLSGPQLASRGARAEPSAPSPALAASIPRTRNGGALPSLPSPA